MIHYVDFKSTSKITYSNNYLEPLDFYYIFDIILKDDKIEVVDIICNKEFSNDIPNIVKKFAEYIEGAHVTRLFDIARGFFKTDDVAYSQSFNTKR